MLTAQAPLVAQTPPTPPKPYAAINRSAISYAGPGRDKAHDLPGPEINIGIILPLSGARKAEGETLFAAAQLAIEDAAAVPIPGGLSLALATRDESGLWGRAASEIVKLVVDDRVIALVTSPDGRVAHLSEQVGNRLSVPVLTLASDSTTTQINIPWLFRIVPSDSDQAQLFAEAIYRKHAFQKVLLLSQNDHDGRVGREEFEKAARRLKATPPVVVEIPVPSTGERAWVAGIASNVPQAIVVWASAAAATRVLDQTRQTGRPVDVYACHKALQEPFLSAVRMIGAPKVWIASTERGTRASRVSLDQRFRARTGAAPSPAAREMYDAVRMIAAGVRASGPNRARLRDVVARLGEYEGASGLISFDGAGNNQTTVSLVSIQ